LQFNGFFKTLIEYFFLNKHNFIVQEMEKSEDLYFTEMKKKIILMEQRLTFLEKLKNEKRLDTMNYLNEIYNYYDYYPNSDFNLSREEPEDNIFKFKNNKEIKIDKIYKKLVLVCHPDKVEDHEFIKLQNFYKNKDLYNLIIMADEYKVNLKNTNIPDMYFILENKLHTLKTQIKNIVNSDEYLFMINDEIGIKKYTKNLIILIKEVKKLKENIKENINENIKIKENLNEILNLKKINET